MLGKDAGALARQHVYEAPSHTSGERRIARLPEPPALRTSTTRAQKGPQERIVDGRYAIGRVIGEGGMGKVYHCRHLRLRSKLAMKILRKQFAFDDELTERFLNEASAASAIDSINVVQMRDCGVLPDGRPYLVMDYLEGSSLFDRMQRPGLLDRDEVLQVFRQICSGLQAAHASGVIHRDLKPENIHLCPTESGQLAVKLLDFGVAKIVDAAGSVSRSGALFGTPQYMSPEQSRGTAVDARSDVYAAGVLLYEMLTGRLPFAGETALQIIKMHRYQPVTPPRDLRCMQDRVTPELEQLVLRCLAKNREDRFGGASELLEQLTLAERTLQITRHALTPPENRQPRSKRGGTILPFPNM